MARVARWARNGSGMTRPVLSIGVLPGGLSLSDPSPLKAEGGHLEIPVCVGEIEQLRDRDQCRHAPTQLDCRQRLAAIDLR
jgi:hypothetical protein